MRKFKFADDTSYKFWNIELEGSNYTVAYGRIGTKGQTKTKEFASPAAAQKAYDKIIAEKLKEGYVEITPPSPPTTTENVLERALMEDPDDLAAHSAYADWLSQEGDPRGEFIQVQLSLEDPGRPAKERKELQKREQELLQKHGRDWLGSLADYLLDQKEGGYQFQFARGWLDHIRVPALSVDFARALAKAPPLARLLRRLVIEGEMYQEAGEFEAGPDIPAGTYNPSMYALLRFPYLANLRVFHLGEPMEVHQGEEYSNCHTSGETAVDLVARRPRIEELYLFAHQVDMKQLFALKNLTKLRILQLYHNHHYPLEVLADNPALKNLNQVFFYPHMPDDQESQISLESVRALVCSPHLTSLTHLQLRLSDMGDEGCEELVRSGIFKRLKMLDMKYGRIGDEGAEILVACADVKNLDLLEISFNFLTDAGIAALKKAGIAKVQATNQYGPGGEEEYLWHGDME
jgi:uncharacterized protein (TIGR02996 family)